MPLVQAAEGTYMALVESGNIRYTVQPGAAVATLLASAGAVGAWVWAAYIQVVAAGTIPNPCWLCGVTCHTGVVGTIQADVAVATGAGGAEVDILIFHIFSDIPTAVGIGMVMPSWLPYPIKIVGSPRLAVRIRKDTGAGVEGCSIKLHLASAVGS